VKHCSVCGFPILDEEEHMKTCHAYKSAKYFWHNTISFIIIVIFLIFIAMMVLK
jgi:predicted nucleic acid-binding Zn ribbon protein